MLMQTHKNQMNSQDTKSRKTIDVWCQNHWETKTIDGRKMESDRQRLQGWQALIGIDRAESKMWQNWHEDAMLIASIPRSKQKWGMTKECVMMSLDHFNHAVMHTREAACMESDLFSSLLIKWTFLERRTSNINSVRVCIPGVCCIIFFAVKHMVVVCVVIQKK